MFLFIIMIAAFLFHVKTYLLIQEDVGISLSLIQYLDFDIYARYYPPFFDPIVCGNIEISEDQLLKVQEKIDYFRSIKRKVINHTYTSFLELNIKKDDFSFEDRLGGCDIHMSIRDIDENDDLISVEVSLQEEKPGEHYSEINIHIILDKSRRRVWFTIK